MNSLIMKCKRSVLRTDGVLSVSEKILHVFSNLTNLCVMKVNAPLPPLILEGELMCSGAKGIARIFAHKFPNYETKKECSLERRGVERQRENLTCFFESDKSLCNESQRPLAPSNLRGGANMQWGKGFARTPTHRFLVMCEPSAEPSLLELC